MNWFSFLAAGVLVYIALAVFILGLAYKVYKWFKVPKSSVRLGLFPKPQGSGRRLLRLSRDNFLFPQVLDVDRWMWLFVILLHLGGVVAFVGHLRLFQEFTFISNILGEEGMSQFSLITGGTVGIVLTVTILYLLIRRFKSPYKDLTVPEDYFLLILVLLIVLMGNHLRFFGDVHVTEYREYIHSLLAFKPAFAEELAASSTRWSLTTHVLLSNILLIYFPFSKLVHFIGSFAGNMIRSD